MATLRIAVRVRPGSSRTRVGGSYGDQSALVVAVSATPVDGAANEAVRRAVAKALDVRRDQIAIASGHAARSKVLSVSVDDEDAAHLRQRLDQLLQGP